MRHANKSFTRIAVTQPNCKVAYELPFQVYAYSGVNKSAETFYKHLSGVCIIITMKKFVFFSPPGFCLIAYFKLSSNPTLVFTSVNLAWICFFIRTIILWYEINFDSLWLKFDRKFCKSCFICFWVLGTGAKKHCASGISTSNEINIFSQIPNQWLREYVAPLSKIWSVSCDVIRKHFCFELFQRRASISKWLKKVLDSIQLLRYLFLWAFFLVDNDAKCARTLALRISICYFFVGMADDCSR